MNTVVEDRFEIVKELGQGGMGAVYLVYDREFCRELALKRIHPKSAGHEDPEQRFRREYRALAAIRDPGVPQPYHSGRTADGAAWFTMEAVRGESLRAILERDTFEPARALDLAIKLGKILAVAHEAGVIHRDVKPSNIMVEPGDRVRLLDFGICAPLPRFLRSVESRRRTAHVDRWRSGENVLAGTIGYSDPSLFEGEPATIRSDIYSLAVILYEMLTGRRYCDPDSVICRSIDSAEFPLALAPLADDLRRAVARQHYQRPRSMAEFVQRLEIARGLLARAAAGTAPTARSHLIRVLVAFAFGIGATRVVSARCDRDPQVALERQVAPGCSQPSGPEPPPPVGASVVPPADSEPARSVASQPAPPATQQPPAPPATQQLPAPPPAEQPTSAPPATQQLPAPSAAEQPTSAPPATRGLPSEQVAERPAADARLPVQPTRRPDAASAQRKLARLAPTISHCIRVFGGSLDGEVEATLTLDRRGRVHAVETTSTTGTLIQCVAAELSGLSFAPGTPTPLTHTFHQTKP